MRRARAVLNRGRRKAAARMIDVCDVGRPGAPVTDPVTGKVTRPLAPVYSGRCEFQQTLAQASTAASGEHEFSVQDIIWKTPVGAGPFEVDDVITVTTAAEDGQLLGRVYRVTELFHKTYATAQRCRVEEVTG
ncbi:DUF6093 family protein [Arthrobacter sp. R-11]|uniref:DUF6093 family protein n=1 Tax=Arthrobacter sp. R-11 TaxID=3404053 RepID=UPI003CEEDE5E